MRGSRTAPVALFASLALVTPALAQEPGVVIDPGSPSGKEYEIPLESRRRLADPSGPADAKVAPGDRSAPLFGAGIVSGDRAAAASSSAGGGESSSAPPERRSAPPAKNANRRPDASPSETESAGAAPPATVRAAASNPGAPAGGAGTPLVIGGVAVGVLALGGLIGLLVRRRT